MYKTLVKPLLFKCSPEKAHNFTFALLKTGQKLGVGACLNTFLNPKSLHMETTCFGLNFPNRVGLAAGLDKNAEAYKMFGKMGFGHVEIGTVTPKGQPGNPKPRSFRLPQDKALINRMGFNNMGLDAAIKKLKNKPKNLIVGGNIGKNTATPNDKAVADYLTVFKGLYAYVDYIVVNVSCPNVTDLHKLQDQEQLEQILEALGQERAKQAVYKPILMKIAPDLNTHQVDETLAVIEKCGVDGVIATNTSVSRDTLNSPKEQIEAIGKGGLSGLPIKDKSTALIRYIHAKTDGKLPIIGVGGILSAQDALEKIEAGASLVQIYTGFIYEGPALVKRINKAIKNYHLR